MELTDGPQQARVTMAVGNALVAGRARRARFKQVVRLQRSTVTGQATRGPLGEQYRHDRTGTADGVPELEEPEEC